VLLVVRGEGRLGVMGSDFQTKLAESMARVSAVFASSLGPFGYRKAILDTNNEMSFLKDGLSIASAQPGGGVVAKITQEIALAMHSSCGDGMSSAIVLAGSLTGNAARLISSGLHPNTVYEGYQMAAEECLSCLGRVSRAARADRRTLRKLVRVSLGTKMGGKEGALLARLVTEAAFKSGSKDGVLDDLDSESINVAGLVAGFGERAELIDGVLLDKAPATVGMPRRLDSPRVAIVSSLELGDSPFDITMVLSSPDSLGRMVGDETALLDAFVTKLEELQVKFIACKGGIDDQVERKLAHKGVLAVKSLKDDDIKMVEGATGGRLTLFSSLLPLDLGMAERVEWKGEADGGIEIAGVANGSSSIVLRMGNKALLEAEVRSVKASIRLISCFLEERRVVAGGGAVETELRAAIMEKAKSVRGRARMAMDAFAEALMATSYALSENAGLDPHEAVGRLIAAHRAGHEGACLDLDHGGTADALRVGLIEPLALKRQEIVSAGEAALTLLKCDEALASVKH
jgi:chaperonin GroEL (HSP60 family)